MQGRTGYFYVAEQEVPARASQHCCFATFHLLEGKLQPCCPPPARAAWRPPCPVGQCPFPGWPGPGRPHSSSPHPRRVTRGSRQQKAAGRSLLWMAMPWVMGRLGAPRPQRRLGTGSPKSTLGTAFHYRLLTSAGSATNYFGTRASHSEQAPRSEVREQLLGEPGKGDCRETAVLARPCWGHLRLSLPCVCRGKL